MMGDILEKDEGWFGLGDDAGNMRPEVARVVRTPTLAGDRKRLARIARSDDIHRAAPWATVKTGNVVPDRCRIQGRVFHPRHESGCGEGVPLDVTHSTISGGGNSEPEVEPACAGAEGESEEACVSESGSAAGGM